MDLNEIEEKSNLLLFTLKKEIGSIHPYVLRLSSEYIIGKDLKAYAILIRFECGGFEMREQITFDMLATINEEEMKGLAHKVTIAFREATETTYMWGRV